MLVNVFGYEPKLSANAIRTVELCKSKIHKTTLAMIAIDIRESKRLKNNSVDRGRQKNLKKL